MTEIRIEEIDLLDRHPHIHRDLGTDTWALFRCGGTPVGSARFGVSRHLSLGDAIAGAVTPRHAENALMLVIAAWMRRSRPPERFTITGAFESLREERASDVRPALGTQSPSVSVAICSRDRPQQLARAVEAIIGTLGMRDELLVILNAPSNAEASFDRTRFPSVRVVVEDRPGLSWARNRAIAEFRGDVLLFTDDDCVPETGWVSAHRAVFARNEEVDLVTGLVEPRELATPAQQLFEAYGGFPRTYVRRWIAAPDLRSVAGSVGNVGEYGAGANFAVRRRVFDQIGPFDAALGPGTASGAGDDSEYLFRALKSRMLLAIEPRAVVRHDHRREMPALMTQVAGWSRGFACAIERSALAFPEERPAFNAMKRQIAVGYHLRRALLYKNFRPLALAEFREMRGAEKIYQAARMTANALVDEFASISSDAFPDPVIASPVLQRSTIERIDLQMDAFARPIYPGMDAPFVDCRLRVGDRVSGYVRFPVRHGVVGADRLGDSMVKPAAELLVDGGWREAVAQTSRYLQAFHRAAH